MPQKLIDNYYNRFDPAKNYERVLLRDGYGAQASEINEIQDMEAYRLRGVADALFKDGDIIRGAQLVVNPETGETRAEAGQIYLDGAVRDVAEAVFSMPVTGSVAVGIRLTRTRISELEDPSLYNPAVGVGTYGEPGGWRLQAVAAWGFEGDGAAGDFYPVHIVDDGVVRSREAPPSLDAFNQGIARYDRDSTGGGSYIVSGLVVHGAAPTGGGAQTYTVSEGRARVCGYGIELPTSRRLSYPAAPDLRYVDTEIHPADGSASQRIDVAHGPIHDITLLKATLRKNVQVVHGAYTGVADALPDTAVVAIVEVVQGQTTYEAGTDYVKTGDTVNWSPTGNEPAPGSTYYVTYDYMTNVPPVDQDADGFNIEGAVQGSSIVISYNQSLPRYDRLCLTQGGTFVWRQGVASEYNARSPVAPDGALALATVYQDWRAQPAVYNDGIRVMTFDALERMTDQIAYLYSEIARQRLEADIFTREAGAKIGMFVDPLLNDEMRDQGITQTAAIVGGRLMLPVAGGVTFLGQPAGRPFLPAYTPSAILAQLLRTGSMPVNPYMSFDVLPARVVLNPATDYWTAVESLWASPVTERFNTGHYVPGNSWVGSSSTTTRTEVLASATKVLEYLRQIDVAFRIEGFGAGEILESVVFDGVAATFVPSTADAQGVAVGTFTIPEKIPAGAKNVIFRGMGGTTGTTAFVGQGMLTVQAVRQINTTVIYWVDPLAQTFVLDENAQVCGVDLWFTAKSGEVRIQIREVQSGVPARVILAEAVLQPDQIIVSGGGHTRALFETPVYLSAGAEYAIVILCNDPTTAVAIAEMSKFDAHHQQWVASQPYTVGVLLSSSNASTWTAHQDKDLTFRLLAAGYVQGVTQLEMGTAQVAGATDLVVLGLEDISDAGSRIEYEITLPDGNTLLVAHGQTVRPAAPVTGAVAVKAKLSGTAHTAPLLWPGAQLLAGTVAATADYYTRSIPATDASKAVLIYDAYVPSGATVTPEIRIDDGEWTELTQTAAVQQGDGLVEYAWEYELATANLLKARFTLTGNSAARPYVSLIRFMAVK
jgi:hypothetical protein